MAGTRYTGAPVAGRNDFTDRSQGRIIDWRKLSLALDIAQTVPLQTALKGAFFYADSDSTGKIYVRANNGDDGTPALPVSCNMAVEVEFNDLYLSWSAQPGKILNLWYGFDVGIIPPNQSITNIGAVGSIGVLDSITPPTLPTTGYWRNSASAALQTIVAPGANVNGVEIFPGTIYASNSMIRLMYKTSAPAAWDDSAAITLALFQGYTNVAWEDRFEIHYVVPAGYGLYEQSNSGGGPSSVSFPYRVL